MEQHTALRNNALLD
jgi:hypothetical protein